MGNKYTVEVWNRYPVQYGLGDKYRYIVYWSGENIFMALYKLYTAKKLGCGCIKLEIR